MFEGMTKGLSEALKKLRGRGRLTEENIREGMREVRRSLLEADVNFTVVNDFIAKVEAKSVGQDVLSRVDPSEQIVKIVYEELCGLMGPVDHKIPQRADRPVVLMLCGLQGVRENDDGGKAGRHVKSPRQKAATRRGRLATARCRRTIANARPTNWRRSLFRKNDTGRCLSECHRESEGHALRCSHSRYRRAIANRRCLDG